MSKSETNSKHESAKALQSEPPRPLMGAKLGALMQSESL